MNFTALKNDVAGMLTREPSDFTENSVDHLANAINRAQTLCQRQLDLHLLKAEGYLPLTDGFANWRTALLDGPGGSSVSAKKLVRIATDEDFYQQIDYVTESDRGRLKASNKPYAYVVGSTLYVKHAQTQSGVYVVYYQLLDDLSSGTDSNILTDFCSDWLTYQAAFDLTVNFLKEEERAQYLAGPLRFRWDSVVAWNENYEAYQDLSLD